MLSLFVQNLMSVALILRSLKISKMPTEIQYMDFLPLLSPVDVILCD